MALVNFTGFEAGLRSGYGPETNTNGNADFTSDGTTVNTGNYSLRCQASAGSVDSCFLLAPGADAAASTTARTNSYFQFYFRYDSSPVGVTLSFFEARNGAGTTKFDLRVEKASGAANDFIHAYDSNGTQIGTGTTGVDPDTWYRISVYVGTGASASWEVRIDGTTEHSGTTDDLDTVGTDRAVLGNLSGNGSADFYYDDFVWDDATWPNNKSRVVGLTPNAAGNYTAWTNAYTEVDEVPHNTTDEITESTLNDAETPGYTSLSIGASDTIEAVKLSAHMNADRTLTTNMALRIRSNGTDSDSTTFNGGQLNQDNYDSDFDTSLPCGLQYILTTDPSGGGAWTQARVNAVEGGPVHLQAQSRLLRCTQLMIHVLYVEVAASLPHKRRGPKTLKRM